MRETSKLGGIETTTRRRNWVQKGPGGNAVVSKRQMIKWKALSRRRGQDNCQHLFHSAAQRDRRPRWKKVVEMGPRLEGLRGPPGKRRLVHGEDKRRL